MKEKDELKALREMLPLQIRSEIAERFQMSSGTITQILTGAYRNDKVLLGCYLHAASYARAQAEIFTDTARHIREEMLNAIPVVDKNNND